MEDRDPVNGSSPRFGQKLNNQNRSASASAHAAFIVELVYFSQAEKMDARGTLSFVLPQLDLPITSLFVSLFVPENYSYGEFEGGMEELKKRGFSAAVPTSSGDVDSRNLGYRARKPQLQMAGLAMGGEDDDAMPIEMEQQQMVMDMPVQMNLQRNVALKDKKQIAPGRAGVMPVQVEVPTVGTCFRFEQNLVTQAPAPLVVDFKRKSQGCCSQRRVSSCTIL